MRSGSKDSGARTALVTGANRGIGLEIVRQLGAQGVSVWLAARESVAGEEAVDTLLNEGGDIRFLQMDVAEIGSIRSAFKTLSSQVGHLDILVNNAGVLLDESTSILDVGPDVVHRTITINTLGAFFVTQTFLPLFAKGSRIINVSSGAGEIGEGMTTYAPVYSISKTAMNAVTCQFALALKKKGIAVNAVCPGWVRTEMGGKMAPRSVKKGAETPVWLATEAPIAETGKFWRDKRVIPW
ncbi:MAG: SDR family NAD(P)-dependent oxidoreductase [Ignavibacteriales bacterium]|nr:SDR family NAD(P)-dependent oxidoreductase [Ignavibacteriales bacterium]